MALHSIRGTSRGHSTGSSGGNGSGSGAGGGGSTTGPGPTGGPAVPITTTGMPPAESAGTLVMRRLTYAEYDHMLADLLGDTTAPAEGGNAWSPDAPNAVGYVAPTSVADLQVDLYSQVTFKANGTTRQSYDAHGSSACAMGCHNLFDPPGFAFENYDGIGAYRTMEAGQPVDSTGMLVTPGNATIVFQNALDLFKQLAKSTEAQSCVDRQWTRYMMGRPETTDEAGSMSVAYQKAAATTGFSVRDLMTSLVTSKAFMYRRPSLGEAL